MNRNIVVEPIVFARMHQLDGTPGESIAMVIDILHHNEGRMPGCMADKQIPDIAPGFVKNSVARGTGKSYKVIIAGEDTSKGLLIQWFVNPKLNFVWVFNVEYPVKFEA